MNEVFIIGKIGEDVKFKFIIESKRYVSECKFEIKTVESKAQIIKVSCYNEIADFCFRKLKKKDIVYVYGKIKDKHIEIEEIHILTV